jgi:predicted glutamine amidotransferase
MCRILCVRAREAFALREHLEPFTRIAENSREYQGHGWGCSWLSNDGRWQHYHDIRPIWEDPAPPDDTTTLLMVHARSAFRDEGIAVENNMPFADDQRVFVFNGELQGVRIKEEGRIGAEKIFNYIKRFDTGDLDVAVERGTRVIRKRSRYVRAMNIIIATRDAVHVASSFGEDPDYFQLRTVVHDDGTLIVCSEPYGAYPWQTFPNHSTRTFAASQ